MLFALLLIPLFAFVVHKSKTDVDPGRVYDPVRVTGNREDLMRLVPNIQRISTKMCNGNKTLGFVFPTESDKWIMDNFAARYSNYKFAIHTQSFSTLEEMKKALNSDLNYTSNKICGNYMGGVFINTIDITAKQFDYRIYVRDREGNDWQTDKFWPDDGPYGALADINSIPSKPNYWSTGYISFKYALDSIFLKEVGRDMTGFDFYLARLPTPKFRNNGLLALLKAMPILFIILVLAVMIHTTKEIVAEKEIGIKTHLIVMGLNSTSFYASHFVIAFIKMFIVMGLSSITLSLGFLSISPAVFIPFCLIFGVAAVVFCILVSVLFRKTSLAVAAVILLWLGLYALDTHIKLSPTNIGLSILQSLNVFSAFHLGLLAMGRYESRLIDLNLMNVFAESTTSFSVGLAFVMLLIDIVIMTLLIFYLDAVWPTDDSPRRHPLFFLPCIPKENIADEMDLGNNEDEFTDNCEKDNYAGRDEADISVQKMYKVWDGGQVAVDGLTLNAYRGHVTVLLGHNGAGKSTTFSVISGICSSTKGEVYICKRPISRNLAECQQQIGFCPQYNPLFEKLTVKEHLRLYGKLKTKTWNEVAEQRMNQLIESNQLSTKANELAGSLSGGMKRKLCVAMALIGDSKVILLDEPTAGMDPEARHEICKVLEAEKKNRTILLTTHYMDEADLLGDQIAILVKGRLVCKGSPEFLKNRFGTGYVLTMVIDPGKTRYSDTELGPIRDRLMTVIRKHAPKAVIDNSSGLQFSVILPTKDKPYFGNLFEELENEKVNLNLSSFGLSFNTLEQVFLKAGEIAENQEDQVDGKEVINSACTLFGGERNERSGPVLYLRHIGAILLRYFINAYRNKIRTFLPLGLAVILFSIATFGNMHSNKDQVKDLSLNALEPVTVPIQLTQEEPIVADFPYIAGKLPGSVILNIPAPSNLTDTLIKHSYDSPALGIGAYVAKNGSTFAYFNGAAYHGPALALSFVTNAILQEKVDSIKTSIEIYTVEASEFGSDMPVNDILVNILTILCFSFLTSVFVMPLVEDRESRFKHQLLLTKMNKFIYWLSIMIWNAVIYLIFCLILSVILLISGSMQECMWTNVLFWVLYFWCAIPFVYVASFIFSSPFKAFVALLTWNIVAGVVASIAITVVLAVGSADLVNYLITIFSIILPSFALGHGIVEVTMQCHSPIIRWESLDKIIICMVISGAFFWIVLVILEKTFAGWVHALLNKLHHGYYELEQYEENEDEDVQAERHRMTQTPDHELALSVRDVSKYFGSFCALRKLTFGVNPTDCFGLLGVNGAGKTTTFDILTGRALPTCGKAFVGGMNIKKMPVIGYCPQFDALAMDLTGRQTLTLLGELNGFSDIAKRVNCVLESIQMMPQADKLVMHYSGGQKRRLSIGVTLMSQASLIMLDEPTAGIDPKTRRHIWNLLTAVRDRKVAILLTSHSMDECEALCSRIGFLNKGSLISIGTSQHLKSRYGSSFLLTFTVANPNQKTKNALDNLVTSGFGAEPTQDLDYMNTYHWEIPRRGNDSWSELYKKAQKIASAHSMSDIISEKPMIKDFSVTQNSLEQVFLRLTQLGKDDEFPDRVVTNNGSSHIPMRR
ncbi:hypothetical protein FO519_001122 [Halicephalobus sp. NKZ332]|nr:hypothetical protein FO519_001122 [Halicephalobus sp. NKZ332]